MHAFDSHKELLAVLVQVQIFISHKRCENARVQYTYFLK